MKRHNRTEEQQKDCIFEIFLKCRSETVSDRRQVYCSRLCEEIYIWYKDYRSVKANKRGLEIVEVINCFIGDEKIAKIPNDKDGFFKYLITSVKNKKNENYHKYNKNDTIRITKEQNRKLREVKALISWRKSQLGRKLTPGECTQSISRWFKKQEYLDLLNALNVGSISHASNDGNSKTATLNYAATVSVNPLAAYIKKSDMKNVLAAAKSLLKKKQERSRACYRALFTLHCIENYKDFEILSPVLDSEILEEWRKTNNKPTQYEIYQQYHSNAKKSSANAEASKNLREFLADIEARLKEKNP